ncbi:Ppx/GppA family phosphatase [Commensalibacter melissae]|uniref:Exopolyphosphatase n=1 Tax=Commensalibacter melissae TaxID=2070537 RepID=A0A318MYJ3_9PROT|nr:MULTISPECIES: Ppx/GppA family phosphatase [Commensalibacter]MCT6851779.1 Ppx/GppA family phosphatase [Commensalibacter sp.]MBI0016491.1 Ppx/GppA family phosphatase [Commensalibacter sp. B14384M2]MBI0049676.1 Ppx/GppA family phosphatase [Commensalibacter sp. B14384M3]MBI0074227.1 Ppx/GppA family phosphatase [Commensalibacter sp. M0357]MBI0084069.1 Ppx/GppA family phosphatase [Commensalibacter sp. M0355]
MIHSSSSIRSAIVDLGSNSVRLVVFEGRERNPVIIFNEKATLRLGSGLEKTGKLNPQGVLLAEDVFKRFYAIATTMKADPFVVLATAAVRDADDGHEFLKKLHKWMPCVPVQILTGEQEADYAAAGVMCSIPNADGVVADIGGGSMELVQISNQQRYNAQTLSLGVIRLMDRAGKKIPKANVIAGRDIKSVKWLHESKKKKLYLVGGAFRAMAQLYMEYTSYPICIVHYYTLSYNEAKILVDWILLKLKDGNLNTQALIHKRLNDLPYAATVLKQLLMILKPSKIIFCAEGVREGWYMRNVIAENNRNQNPQEAAALDICKRLGRVQEFPSALIKWTDSLFNNEDQDMQQKRWVACMISDCGCHDHPAYRKEQAYYRILRMAGMAFDHQLRAFLALTIAIRYDATMNDKFLSASKKILSPKHYEQAVILGLAFRLAYTLSGNLPNLLLRTRLKVGKKKLTLYYYHHLDAVISETVSRRLSRLGQLMGLDTKLLPDHK